VKFQAHLRGIREQHKFNLLARALKAAMRVLHARSLSLSLHYLFTKYLSATMAFLLRPCRLMTQLL
jgi:hypothetical protein